MNEWRGLLMGLNNKKKSYESIFRTQQTLFFSYLQKGFLHSKMQYVFMHKRLNFAAWNSSVWGSIHAFVLQFTCAIFLSLFHSSLSSCCHSQTVKRNLEVFLPPFDSFPKSLIPSWHSAPPEVKTQSTQLGEEVLHAVMSRSYVHSAASNGRRGLFSLLLTPSMRFKASCAWVLFTLQCGWIRKTFWPSDHQLANFPPL